MPAPKTKKRGVTLKRETRETMVELSLCIDGQGEVQADTGYGMADHLITLMAVWAGFDLGLKCRGDLHVDAHHSVEDVGLCLGQALDQALGNRVGIARSALAGVPMDEALARVCVDLSGRSFLVFRGQELLPPLIAGEENDLWREFFKAFAGGGKMNLHINFEYGKNGHHLLESACKGLGLCLRDAVKLNRSGILSTKGSLDL
ncbi:MAG: imidazoleglycerol-phosphate dehydratase [Desulfovibrio sp.]|jgi:imidazoleglycerol-phosphate dehydratase|nr:imidazoleglycerol-phosphate dehydratase [Desulfovibrio sp.]